MTTPSEDRPVSEPMTDEAFAAMTEELQRLGPEAAAHPTHASWSDRIVYSLWLRCVCLEMEGALNARALPLPRRYTGGPLEDGLYLWRWPGPRRGDFVLMRVEDGKADLDRPRLDRDQCQWAWLIGPITIPDIPSEEA